MWQRQLHAASRLLSMLAKLLHRSQTVYLQHQMCLLIRTPSGKQNTALQGCSITLSHLNMTDDLCTWQSMPLRQLLAFHSLVHLQIELVANGIHHDVNASSSNQDIICTIIARCKICHCHNAWFCDTAPSHPTPHQTCMI